MSCTTPRTERKFGAAVVALALAALFAVVGAACGDDGGGDGTGPDVSFGSGSIPDPVPEDFPIPPGAIIGSTLVDRINNRTELEMRLRDDQATTAQYFTVNLVNRGFVIDDSRQETGGRWVIDFRRADLRGSVLIIVAAPGSSQVVLDLNVS